MNDTMIPFPKTVYLIQYPDGMYTSAIGGYTTDPEKAKQFAFMTLATMFAMKNEADSRPFTIVPHKMS